MNCHVPREGYRDDSLAAVNSYFRKMAVALAQLNIFLLIKSLTKEKGLVHM